MIRTKTTFIVGAGASCELQMPTGPELIARIAQALDFDRFNAELQTRDSTLLAQDLVKAAGRAGKSEEEMFAAARRLRTASKLGGSIEHFLPHAFMMAFGMNLSEAQRLVAGKLNILRPYGSIGRLPWQSGEAPECEWATDTPWNIHNLAGHIRTLSEQAQNRQLVMALQSAVASAKRLMLLGFGFQPQNIDLLFDRGLSHQPEVLMTLYGMAPTNRNAVTKTIRRKTGLERDDQLMIQTARAYEMMRDYSMLLES
jgi:hypothetical protein